MCVDSDSWALNRSRLLDKSMRQWGGHRLPCYSAERTPIHVPRTHLSVCVFVRGWWWISACWVFASHCGPRCGPQRSTLYSAQNTRPRQTFSLIKKWPSASTILFFLVFWKLLEVFWSHDQKLIEKQKKSGSWFLEFQILWFWKTVGSCVSKLRKIKLNVWSQIVLTLVLQRVQESVLTNGSVTHGNKCWRFHTIDRILGALL